jgi:hypothetical protein
MSAQTTTTELIPDVRAGDRITVNPGARSATSGRRLTCRITLEVTYMRREEPGHLTVSGIVLTKLGAYSAAGALEGRNVRAFHIAGPAGAMWAWYGEAPEVHTRAALVADLVATYGVDRREAVAAVDQAAAAVQAADAGRYGTAGNVPGWSASRDEPTEAGALVIREKLAATYAGTAARAASSAVRLGCPRTIDPAGRMVFTDGLGRGWVLQLRRDGAYVVGTIAPHETVMRPLASGAWPEGVPARAGDAAIARQHLRAVAEPATVELPVVGTVPALGAYLRPVALACADAVAGRWLVVAWPADAAPVVLGDSDESTLARAEAHQAVALYGTRVYLARRTAYGTTVYARTGEGAAFGTMPAEAPSADPGGPSARKAWEHLVRGAGASDPRAHAAAVREAVRRTVGLPADATAEVIDQALADAEAAAQGDQPWVAFIQAFVHVVGDPIGHRAGR